MKKNLRNILLKKRNSIGPEEKKLKDTAIRKRLFALVDFKAAKNILFYASFRSEVDTMASLKRTFKQRKKVALPLVDEKRRKLFLYRIKDVSELTPGYMGIPEPGITRGRKVNLKDIDVVIVPGAGFDVRGNRLGYGFGYYDKLLSKSERHVTAVALAFEEQIIPEVPGEKHDIKIDKIVTDKRVINCVSKRSLL